MKIRTTLSGIAALLLVGSFYSFAFCMVEDVDDTPISMDYYYSTETDAASGEKIGEATSAFDPSKYNFAETDIVTHFDDIILDIDEIPTPVQPVANYKSDSEEPADVENEPKEGDDPLDDSAEADEQDVFAENSAANKLLSKLDTPTTVTEVPVELTDDEDVTETAAEAPIEEEIFPDEEDLLTDDDDSDEFSEPLINDAPIVDITTVAPVPVADVIITFIDSNYTTAETTVTTTAPVNAVDISTDETLTVKYGGAVHTVNAFDLVCQIVNNEVSGYFNDEAIKAQAVAAYSYVKYNNVNGITPSVLVRANPSQRIIDMVSSVWGKACYYNGNFAQTVYMASSSGYTASACNVWGGNFAYLTSVACPFDAESDPNYGLVTKFSESVVRSSLEQNLGITLSADPSNWLTISGYIDGNYVSQVTVDGQVTISGRKLRENVLNYQLKSASFDVSYADGFFTFTTYGWGHGVGMSQNGANILAKNGYTYDQILKYYFTGIDVL